jgi:hypothetical protein
MPDIVLCQGPLAEIWIRDVGIVVKALEDYTRE